MKTSVKTVFKCEFCGKNLFRKSAMERHEKWCYNNPENNKRCFDQCKYLEETEVSIFRDEYDGSTSERLSKCFLCKKKLLKMFPPVAERRGLPEKYPETFEDQTSMPKECEFYESRYS